MHGTTARWHGRPGAVRSCSPGRRGWTCLLKKTRQAYPRSRQRVYTYNTTLQLFLEQSLGVLRSCRTAARKASLKRTRTGQTPISASSAGYCKARRRLPTTYLEDRLAGTIAAARTMVKPGDLWHGRRVLVADATSFNLPDTPANQAVYPQHVSQKPGCGFPMVQICGVFDLASASLVRYDATSIHEHEAMQLRRMHTAMPPGSVLIADRAFSGYYDVATWRNRGVDCLMRKMPRLQASLTFQAWLGPKDRLCHWIKPDHRPKHMAREVWKALPREMLVRHVTVKVTAPSCRTRRIELVTTLLDPVVYPAKDLADLFRRRWMVELCLDDIKTVLGMDMLRCQSPEMVAKEILVGLVAYNLIRLTMLAAGALYGVPADRLSFTGSRDALVVSQPLFDDASLAVCRDLLIALLWDIAHDRVPLRPHRREPRAIKRRPKNYPWLTANRHVFKEIHHRKRYRKAVLS